MTMSRQIRVLPMAKGDLRRIAQMIQVRVSFASSKKWRLLIQKAISDLANSAETYPEAHEAKLLGRNIRMKLVGKQAHVYRILFTYTDDEVIVHHIRHAAQDYVSEDEF
jgi:plasmid stabilization system protein ParE